MRITFLFLLIYLILSNHVFACEMTSAYRHTNPDSSEGGLVNSKAKVAATAYLAYEAKVCDSAWVDGNAKVLDQAVIKGNAWVREFSTVKDKAVIDEHAVLWGNQGFPVQVSDSSVIAGSTKILAGTTIQGNARVSGEATIKSSTIGGNARICGGFILSEKKIYDDYFCTDSKLESRADIEIINYKNNILNEISDEIEFGTRLYDFYPDRSVYVIWVNGLQIEPESILVEKKKVRAVGLTLKEGENFITFKGRDEYQKEIKDHSFSFIAGSQSKSIQLFMESKNIPIKSKLEIGVIYGDKELEAIYDYHDGFINLKGIPEEGKLGLAIRGVFDGGYLLKSFPNINDIPATLDIENFSSYINNNLDFQSLDDWSISHPENVEILPEKSGRKMQIRSNVLETVTVSKNLKLSKSKRGVHVKFNFNNSRKSINSNSKVQISLVSSDHKIVESRTFNQKDLIRSNNVASFYKGVDAEGFYSLVVTLFPNNDDVINILGIDEADIFISFNPMNFFANNKVNNSLISTNLLGNKEKCDDEDFFLFDEEKYKVLRDENLSYFSAAKETPLMENFNENRVFGNVIIDGIYPAHIAELELVILQEEKELFRTGLSMCAKERLKKLVTYHNSNKLILRGEDSLVHYLFAIEKSKLGLIKTTRMTEDGILPNEIFLRVDVHLQRPVLSTFSSPILPLEVLSTPQLPNRYAVLGRGENYDSMTKGILKTGGDKWINPAYQNIFESIMQVNYGGKELLRVNDISKLNGGPFPIHTEHKDGLSADIFFLKNQRDYFDLRKIKKDSEWKIFLDTLEFYLKRTAGNNNFIEDYYISLESEQLESAKSQMYKRFKNRCIGNRFITFPSAASTGSLFRDVVGHADHLHLNFKRLDGVKGVKPDVITNPFPQLDINKLEFVAGEGGETVIQPREKYAAEFSDKYILWRFQDKRGFADKDMLVAFGEWTQNYTGPIDPASQFTKNESKLLLDFPVVYGYIVLGQLKSGECSCYRVEMVKDDSQLKIVNDELKKSNRIDCYDKDAL